MIDRNGGGLICKHYNLSTRSLSFSVASHVLKAEAEVSAISCHVLVPQTSYTRPPLSYDLPRAFRPEGDSSFIIGHGPASLGMRKGYVCM